MTSTRDRTLWAVDSWDAAGARRGAGDPRRRRRKLEARYRRRRIVALAILGLTLAWFFTVIHTGAAPRPQAPAGSAASHPDRLPAPVVHAPVGPGSQGAADRARGPRGLRGPA